MEIRNERLSSIVNVLASRFFSEESNGTSLITVTSLKTSPDGKYATIYFTVLPEDKEQEAIDFAKRRRSDFRQFVMKESRIQRIPFFDFQIDMGEKHRQKIDVLTNTN